MSRESRALRRSWSGGDADGRAAVNTLNQAFVDTVRAVGGK